MKTTHHHRRVTVADHERFQRTGQCPHLDDADLEDVALVVPNAPSQKPKREVNRLLSILDNLNQEARNR